MKQQGTLYILGATTEEMRWLQTGDFPFSLLFPEEIPIKTELPALLFLSIPIAVNIAASCKPQIPFICFGELSEIDVAFLIGAKDFIRRPFDKTEFTARISRHLVLEQETQFPEHAIYLQGNTIHGPRGSVQLNDDEANILRILSLSENHRIHRRILQEHLKKGIKTNSRSIDMIISRLRHKLHAVSDQDKPLQIKTIYGYGYQI
ncbi:MAG TPA: winged helix-turn-helix domain-containing protein [Treponema sp.]|nr:winged helix-turn-helix domain-containing protein [Treponema sp.]HPC70843.1 winged helix-turn-helix domain-containing protein [Treponema sp.]HRS03243.1 winged helix-turn-helix domain-containing protein [Treponema sp.]HRU28121.1 winged helix-turn-helix domain-containing protein [Treponema sp.]